MSGTTLEAGLAWIRAGISVLLLHGASKDGTCDCGKKDYKSRGKQPIEAPFPEGHHSAINDEQLFQRLCKKHRNANLAIGLPSGVVVLDVDGPIGKKTFECLNLPKTAAVKTGRGTHTYFRAGGELPKQRSKLDGIDAKDSNGYVVVLPSRHKSGTKYRWMNRSGGRMLAKPPESFLQQPKRDPIGKVSTEEQIEKALHAITNRHALRRSMKPKSNGLRRALSGIQLEWTAPLGK